MIMDKSCCVVDLQANLFIITLKWETLQKIEYY